MKTMPPFYILYSPAILYLIIYFSFLSLKKTKVFFFGIMFFLINILPVSSVLNIGSFVVADRYTYISYLGLFFILAKIILYLYNNTNKYLKFVVIFLLLTIFANLYYLTYKRTLDWKQNKYMAPKEMKYYKFGIIKAKRNYYI
jgi:hypothetical protein